MNQLRIRKIIILYLQSHQFRLATALVTARAKNGQPIVLRALIDQGSQATFITEDAVQTLKLSKKPCVINFTGIGEISSKSGSVVDIDVMPHFISDFILSTTAIAAILLAWCGNMDIQFIGGKSGKLTEYITKYQSKAEKSFTTEDFRV